MEPIDWTLPDPNGTLPAGHTADSWERSRVECPAILSVQDLDDLYMIGFLLAGVLLFGISSYLICKKVGKMLAVLESIGRLPDFLDGMLRILNTQTQTIGELKRLLRKHNDALEKLKARLDRMDHNN